MKDRIDCARASPEGLEAFAGVYAVVESGGLPKHLLVLVYLRVPDQWLRVLHRYVLS